MKIGSKIVYPMHGAGIVVDIEHEDFFGKRIEYCTMKVAQKDMTLKFPLDRSENLHIRKVSNMEAIFGQIREKEPEEYIHSSNWNKRYQATLEKMKVGSTSDMATVLVNLKSLETIKGLSSGERQLYHTAMDILTSELMLIKDCEYEGAYKLLEQCLEDSICEV
ncbi:MAG TPA: CarD family transcriptional regulator [Clostridia bacterium]|nr:CarD family transcriptional regulator [Clostridia bacterium]